MNQQKILELIHASQSTLKHELLVKYPEAKYDVLMLLKSMSIIEKYMIQAQSQEQEKLELLKNYFKFPVENLDHSMQQLCAEIRTDFDFNTLEVLKQLNQLDLKITQTG